METNENEQEISLFDLFRIIINNKFKIIISTIVVTIIATLIIALVYNPHSEKYTIDFTYDYASQDNGNYIDGTIFNYKEMVSLDRLTEVKSANNDFVNIDATSMANSNAITISLTPKDKDILHSKNVYSITVNSSYFDSKDLAQEYLKSLIDYEKNIGLESSKEELDANVKVAQSTNTFYAEINAFKDQYNYLKAQYDSMEKLHPADKNVLEEAKSKLETFYSINNPDSLISKLKEKGFIKADSSNSAAYLQSQLNALNLEYDKNEKYIDTLAAKINAASQTSVNLDTYITLISDVVATQVVLSEKIDILNAQMNHNYTDAEYKSFNSEVYTYLNDVIDHTKTAESIFNDINIRECKVSYQNTSLVVSSGTLNIVVSVVVIFIIALVAFSALVILFVSYNETSKDEKHKKLLTKKPRE